MSSESSIPPPDSRSGALAEELDNLPPALGEGRDRLANSYNETRHADRALGYESASTRLRSVYPQALEGPFITNTVIKLAE
ncbi:hypothetical protein H0H92_010701, partial [Tricholoma furcatifolium]